MQTARGSRTGLQGGARTGQEEAGGRGAAGHPVAVFLSKVKVRAETDGWPEPSRQEAGPRAVFVIEPSESWSPRAVGTASAGEKNSQSSSRCPAPGRLVPL